MIFWLLLAQENNRAKARPMLVEHSFVTTLEEPEAMSAAAGMLTSAGFFDEKNAKTSSRQWGHGIERPRTASQARKTVRLSYDRGRVAFAASARFARAEHAKLYEPVLIALANAAETLLVSGAASTEALAPVQQAIGAVYAHDRRRLIATRILVGILATAILGSVAAVYFFARH